MSAPGGVLAEVSVPCGGAARGAVIAGVEAV